MKVNISFSGLWLALGAAALAQPAQAQNLFQAPQQFLTDLQTNGVAVGDINSDGRKDVVVTGCCGFQTSNKVYLFLGQADGTLTAQPVVYLSQASGGGVQIGDVTADGRPDIVMRSGFGIEVIAQNAAGGLEPSILYPTNYGEAARIGDLNGDGRIDVIGLESSSDGHTNTEEAGIFYQNPAGSFDAQVLVPLPHGFNDDMELADLNNDGRLDVVVADPFNEPVVVILYQTASGTLSAPVGLSIGAGLLAQQLGVGDINNDGRKDLVVSYGGYVTDVHLAIFRQNADGTFAAPVLSNAADWLTAVEVADANNDGRKDILLLHQAALGVILQNADGTLGAESLLPLPPAGGHNQFGLVAADINGDGMTDVAYSQVGAQGALTVLYGAIPPPPSNHPPVARPDTARTVCDSAVVIAVLANDSDPDGDTLSITGISKPANGTAKLAADKRIRYEPKRRFIGVDRFTYTISDGKGGTATATVTVTVR